MHPHATAAPHTSRADLPGSERSLVERYHSRRSGWKRFAREFRSGTGPLLARIDAFPGAVLVAGCQRSGTTMITRLIAASSTFRRFALTHDDELDAALILAGAVTLPGEGRYCFQTTYLNERRAEYATLRADQRLIWVVRNPHSVVFSMVYNWRRFALEELYQSCGRAAGESGISRWQCMFGDGWAEKACLAYRGKAAQLFELPELVRPGQLLIVDYDALVRDPAAWLPRVFSFIGAPYDAASAMRVRRDSIGKSKRLSARERALVDTLAQPTYEKTLALVSRAADAA